MSERQDALARVVRRKDLLAEGVTRAQVEARSGSIWPRLHRGVVLLSSEEPDFRFLAQAAIVAVAHGAILSHLSAAKAHGIAGADGLPGFWKPTDTNRVEVTIGRGTSVRPRKGVKIHRADLRPSQITAVRGLPVTSIPRTLVDLLLTYPRELAAVAVEDAVNRGLVPASTIERLLVEVGGRRGAPHARVTLSHIRNGAESPLETLSRLRFADLGLVASVIQPVIRDSTGRFVGRADLGFGGDPPVVLGEADGVATHGGLEMRAKDAQREEALRLMGFEVVRWSWADLVNHPDRIVQRIRAFATLRGAVA